MYKPIKIELLEVAGLTQSMRAMRLPKRSKSDSFDGILGEGDRLLAGKLIKAGDDHAKAMRGIIAWIKIEMQVGFMVEFETYRQGVECLSTSSTIHTTLKGMSGAELANKKQEGLKDLVYNRIVIISYQALRSMYKARRHHKHPDWHLWAKFTERLPYFDELIFP